MTIYRHRYREGLDQSQAEMVRQLRLAGWAVVIMKAGAMRRGEIETEMRKAAKKTLEKTT